jgi:hypothetical protein
MPETKQRGGRTRPQAWSVVVEPCGTPAEAELAARQARRLVAEWLMNGAGDSESAAEGDR